MNVTHLTHCPVNDGCGHTLFAEHEFTSTSKACVSCGVVCQCSIITRVKDDARVERMLFIDQSRQTWYEEGLADGRLESAKSSEPEVFERGYADGLAEGLEQGYANGRNDAETDVRAAARDWCSTPHTDDDGHLEVFMTSAARGAGWPTS